MPEAPAAIVAAAYQADAGLAPLLLAVAHEESTFDPNATGALGEQGLTQIRPEFWQPLADHLFGAGASLFDVAVNLGTAAAIMRERLARSGGDLYDALQPWSTRAGAWALYQAGAFAAAVDQGGAVGVPAAGGSFVVPVLLVAALAWAVLR